MLCLRSTGLRAPLATLLVTAACSGCFLSAGGRIGARASGERLERLRSSPQWDADKQAFTNALKRIDGDRWARRRAVFFGGSSYRRPAADVTVKLGARPDFSAVAGAGLRITWLGHSSILLELDGVRTLVDPIWSERASPFQSVGPRRFFPPPFALSDLPPLDAVVISHDHYDHLDYDTVVALRAEPIRWIVPLGVGAHLEHWGVPKQRIVELDWWARHRVGEVTITATPSRHFSGRAITMGDRDATLWAGWAWRGPQHSVFYSGDTAFHRQFKAIGERLGPFDVTLMEVGAYSRHWGDVHLGPEQAVLAHRLVRGGVLIPVHWGAFNMSLHGWTEPAERVIVAARQLGVPVAVLRPGGSYSKGDPARVDRWWPQVPWDRVERSPAWSSQVESLQAPLRRQGEPSPSR